jgi:flavin reductase (DIM6/NTAB) family NADH-FMN oxidoreductase RutF
MYEEWPLNAGFGARAFREAMGWFATGVTIITTRAADGAPVGITVNSFGSVSLDPPLVQFNLDRTALSLPAFRCFGHFAVNVLTAQQEELCRRFAKAGTAKWEGIAFTAASSGCPILPDVLAAFDCATEATYDAGDHVLFIGRVLELAARRRGHPLLFSRGNFHALGDPLRGAAPVPPGTAWQIENLYGLEPWFSA